MFQASLRAVSRVGLMLGVRALPDFRRSRLRVRSAVTRDLSMPNCFRMMGTSLPGASSNAVDLQKIIHLRHIAPPKLLVNVLGPATTTLRQPTSFQQRVGQPPIVVKQTIRRAGNAASKTQLSNERQVSPESPGLQSALRATAAAP